MFKELFTEKSSQSTMRVDELMQYGYLPISTPMMDRLGFSEENFEAFHATSVDHLKGLEKLGKSKKGVSTFTFGLPSVIRNVIVMPEVLVKIKGTRLLGASADFYTYLDKSGRRWFKVKGKNTKFMREALLVPTVKYMDSLVNQQSDDDEIDMYVNGNDSDFVSYFADLTQKQKKDVIQFYMRNAEKVMNSSATFKIIMKHLKAPSDLKHDEIIMNKFKITRVYSLEANKYEHNRDTAQKDIESLGLEYWGHIPKNLFSEVTTEKY